ncbi:MAG: hypothetical protein CVU56_06150, partial [Deltaproteobacteria bacterium HGW-Deltaproteobacteria-14]
MAVALLAGGIAWLPSSSALADSGYVSASFTGSASVPTTQPYYVFGVRGTIGDVGFAELGTGATDYEVPWCSSFGCCDSASYNAYSISRRSFDPETGATTLYLTGGDRGPAWVDGYVEVSEGWEIVDASGSIGSEPDGAHFSHDGQRLDFHGGLSYGGCVCSDCGRFNFEIVVMPTGAGSCDTPGECCGDGVPNGDETDVDCGGSCSACGAGQGCAGASDCLSGVCTDGVCQAPACDDGVTNGQETDV